MPIDIHGWVETTRQDEPERSNEHAWSAAVNLGALIDGGDLVSHQLFGIGLKNPPSGSQAFPLAAARGLPPFPSAVVASDIAAIHALEEKHGLEWGGYTHATWGEVLTADLSEEHLRASDWSIVFALVQTLASDARFGPDKIRLVVWYSI